MGCDGGDIEPLGPQFVIVMTAKSRAGTVVTARRYAGLKRRRFANSNHEARSSRR